MPPNLRGTGFAARDVEVRTLRARVGVEQSAEINVTGLAGFLLAKCAAARSRRARKDWYDIAFVLLHNDAGGPEQAAESVVAAFRHEELNQLRTALDDLRDSFADPDAQGPQAYADQMMLDQEDVTRTALLADAVVAIEAFHRGLRLT